MTIRQAIDEQFTKLDLSKLSRRGSDDLHLAKALSTYGWAKENLAQLKQKRGK